MKNEKLKTDGDIMVYLRNAMRALAEIAEQTGEGISLYARPDGFATVDIGDYSAIQHKDGYERCQYRPNDIGEWKSIESGQVNFAGKPIKSPWRREAIRDSKIIIQFNCRRIWRKSQDAGSKLWNRR